MLNPSTFVCDMLQMRAYHEKQRLDLAAKAHPDGWYWFKALYTGTRYLTNVQQKLSITPEQEDNLRMLTPYERSMGDLNAGS